MRLSDGVVVLRPWRDDDVDAAVRATADPEIVRWTRVPENNTADDVRAHVFADVAGERRLVIADAETGAFLGAISVLRRDAENARAEIGYYVTAERRGAGVATRALRLLADWALADGGLRRVELHIDPDNAASRRVAESGGFELEGILRSYELFKGRRADVAMYARLAG